MSVLAGVTRSVVREASASYAFVERNFNLVRRYWGWELVWLIYSVVNALAITYIGAGMEAITGVAVDTNYLVLYLLVGSLVWGYLDLVFHSISETISWERWEGTIEYTFMAPVSRRTHLVGQTLFSLVYGLLFTSVIFVVVALFFRLSVSGANFAGALAIAFAGSISFIGFGIVTAVLPLLFPEKGDQMTHVVEAVLLLVSGIYYPVDVLPGWMQRIAAASPATYALRSMRAAILEGADWGRLLPDLGILLGMGLVAIPLGLYVFSKAEYYAKRSGKLKRSG
ncbi:MAG: ABC transporter permease [Anaerolineae bacterium]|nr:ABC transporter permease [Anaerolineae bacterium]